jgi:hypothetical protein
MLDADDTAGAQAAISAHSRERSGSSQLLGVELSWSAMPA